MPQDNKIKILKAIKSKNLSATAIAHALGYSKSKSIMVDIDDLISEGSITTDHSGRFITYKAAVKLTSITKPTTETSLVGGKEIKKEKLPEATNQEVDGFSVSNIRYKGKRMKKIVTPGGDKIRMDNDQKLLVINDQPKYVVKTAQDIITCIRKYSMDNDLNVFTVDDIKQNQKISNENDVMVKDDHIMFLKIKKHNKAA